MNSDNAILILAPNFATEGISQNAVVIEGGEEVSVTHYPLDVTDNAESWRGDANWEISLLPMPYLFGNPVFYLTRS